MLIKKKNYVTTDFQHFDITISELTINLIKSLSIFLKVNNVFMPHTIK